ncbi:MAG: IPT/TIG domain-containing protein [Bacteroidaceae bacterium]|nr:IPT/TIG domain-containing protein [Bacteroidaceae bacterium]
MMKKLKSTVWHGYLCGILLAFAVVGFTACTDKETDDKNVAFDPNQEIVISDFTPKSGSMGQQLVILGNNFGNDKSQVKVKIGGKDAKVINVCNTALYAYIPSAAFDKIEGKDLYGSVSVTVGDKTGVAPDRFEYERKMIVGRLCGQSFERYEDVTWQDGGFDECTGFKNDGVMQFSPYNHDQLFIVYDQEPRFGTVAHGIQLLDLKAKTVETILPLSMFHNERLRTIDFAVDPFAYDENGAFERRQKVDETGTPMVDDDLNPIMEMVGRAPEGWEATATPNQKRWREHLIISTDNNNDQYRARSVYLVDRDANGNFSKNSKVIELANYRQCNGASLHPVNGELYFTSYTQGEVLRLEMDTYWASRDTSDAMTFKPWDPYVNSNLTDAGGNVTGTGAFEKLFTVQDVSWEFQIDIHPSGKYAYIVVINRSYILRTDYNETTKRFSAPYVIAGDMSHAGFQDGVGKSALMHRPYQGTFVKNEDYEAAGASDIYDFYFCDSENDAIRLLTPEGIVKTYAGGSAATHADGNTYGNENGELRDFARFHRPTGLVNDVHKDAITGLNTLIFYILDTYNYMIRTITMEENLDATVVNP